MKKICVICGRTFDSHYGSEVCSQNCFTIRKRINDENSNLRRKNHESNTPILKKCPVCGQDFEGLRNKYCSKKCAQIMRSTNIKIYNKYYYKNNLKEFCLCAYSFRTNCRNNTQVLPGWLSSLCIDRYCRRCKSPGLQCLCLFLRFRSSSARRIHSGFPPSGSLSK